MTTPMDEELATIHFDDGATVKMVRTAKGLRIEGPHGGMEVSLSRATGQQAFDLLTLMESLGQSVEFPDDEEDLT